MNGSRQQELSALDIHDIVDTFCRILGWREFKDNAVWWKCDWRQRCGPRKGCSIYVSICYSLMLFDVALGVFLCLSPCGVAHGGTVKWIKKSFFGLFVRDGIFYWGASRGTCGPSYLGLCWWRCHVVGWHRCWQMIVFWVYGDFEGRCGSERLWGWVLLWWKRVDNETKHFSLDSHVVDQ